MKRYILVTIVLLSLAIVAWGSWYLTRFNATLLKVKVPPSSKTFLKIQSKATAAKKFVTKNNYNKTLCFLIDMSIESGANRFFVYNLERDSVINGGLVTHGRCNEEWLTGRKYGTALVADALHWESIK